MLHCNRSQSVSIHKDCWIVSGHALPPYISASKIVLFLTDTPGYPKQLGIQRFYYNRPMFYQFFLIFLGKKFQSVPYHNHKY